MHPWRAFAIVLALILLALTACGVDPASAPTLTPDPALIQTAAALFPSRAPTAASTATPVAASDEGERIATLLSDMAFAIRTGNVNGYLIYVDLSDPVFATEQANWAVDWHRHRLSRFELTLRLLTVQGDQATATLTMRWTLSETQVSRGADFPVRFTRGADEQWRYAGVNWVTFETEHFRVRVMPGLEAMADPIIALLPDVYDHVTRSLDAAPLDAAPDAVEEIKIYDEPLALIATTGLSLPEIAGWNEPGEALKLVVRGADPPDQATFAHEYAHVVVFGLGADARDNIPWWAHEGVAEYVASHFWTLTERNAQLAEVQAWQAEEGLVAWEAISDFAETPQALWRYVYPQGYAFVRYLTETYGQDARNAWLRAMAGGLTLPEASREAFAVSFGELNDGFLAWLAAL